MKKLFVLIVTLLFTGLSGIMFAQELQPSKSTATPKITKKQVRQQARIKQGVKSGELTRREAAKLEKEQAKIQHDKKEAKSDGKVTPEERKKIRHEQNKASRDIYRKKHNVRTRK
jgi:hypothetical protein